VDNIIRANQKKKQSKNYFTQETEDAIVLYNNTKDPNIRSLIYSDKIHYAFYKLTQNIIHTFKFYYTDNVENLEDLQHEIMIFLLDKIHLFNPQNGAKAYSYFGTIVKRWLIVYNQKNYVKKVDTVHIDDISNYQNSNTSLLNSSKLEDLVIKFTDDGDSFLGDELSSKGFKEGDRLSLFIDKYIDYCTNNIYNLFPKESDACIADAVLELFRKREFINIFNKKALYIFIREQVDIKTPRITKVTKKLHSIFQEKYLLYLETDILPS
jgi:hypothetical protein